MGSMQYELMLDIMREDPETYYDDSETPVTKEPVQLKIPFPIIDEDIPF